MIYLDSTGHLYSDESLQELYNFAVKKLGLKAHWNHYSMHFPHFDLTTQNKKNQAFRLGAIQEPRETVLDTYKETRKVFLKFHIENKHLNYWYESKGLLKQKILRISFHKLGIK